jgi:ATP-dependent exoDNAse (exonuclease V) alpha subunit
VISHLPDQWNTCLPYITAFARKIGFAVKSEFLKCAALAACLAVSASVPLALGYNPTMRIIETQTMIIRHTATEYQRRVAEQNAKAFFKKLTPTKKAELKKKKVKAVLIPTVRSRETSPEATEVRMRYNLEGELIDNYTYEFKSPLQTGTIAKVSGLELEYVGP